jgi:hypothetical protein
MNSLRNKTKTYTQYQVDKLLSKAEEDFEAQWNERVNEITTKVFETVKLDMFSQYMSVAMATLEQFNGFSTEQTTKFYNDFISLLHIMKDKPLGKNFTPQDTINHVQNENNIDLDVSLKEHSKEFKIDNINEE